MPVPTKYIYKENEREVDVMPNLANQLKVPGPFKN